jgi:hypothetical protein
MPLCTPGSCSRESEELAVYNSASLVAFKNVCSRLEPSKAKHYSDAFDKLASKDRVTHLVAMNSKLFPSALEGAESELLEQPIPMIRRDCVRLLPSP